MRLLLSVGERQRQAQEKAPGALRAAGWVVIPVEEYRVLRAKAYPVEQNPEAPPVEATLTRVDYDLRISVDLATGRASLTVDVLKDGWVRVPVPAGLLVCAGLSRAVMGQVDETVAIHILSGWNR